MKEYGLIEFFNLIDYNYTKDLENLGTICKYTKTRIKSGMSQIHPFPFVRGMEQTFFIKAVLEWFNARSFFEIGTGRGTASYAAAIIPEIEKITTIDIIPFQQKTNTAVNFQPAFVSNKDIYDLIPFSEKRKILFKTRDHVEKQDDFDVCFIDGNHDHTRTILEDLIYCRKVMRDDGIIIWDDYDQTRYSVKKVVDALLEKEEGLQAIWIHTRGHLFGENEETDAGIVLMRKGKIL